MDANSKQTTGATPQPENQGKIQPDQSGHIVTPGEIRKQIELWKTTPVTLGGVSGYFIDRKELHACCDYVDKQLEATDGAAEWQHLSDQLDIVRGEAKAANKIISDLRVQNAEALEKAKAIQAMEGDRVAELTEELANFKATKSDLQDQLSAAKAALLDATKDLNAAGKGFDTDLVKTLAGRRDVISGDVKSIQSELAAANKTIKLLTADKKTSEKAIKAASDELASVRRALDQANKLKSAAFSKETAIPEVPLPTIKTPLVKRLIGDKGLRWLQEAETTVRNDYKDRALKLMSAARSSNDKNLKSLGDLLELIFQWLKTQSYRARSVVSNWLAEIECDLRAASVKNISYYRDSLKRLRDEHKLRIAGIREKKAEQEALDRGELPTDGASLDEQFAPTMFENAWTWVKVVTTRVKRVFVGNPKAREGVKTPFQKFVNGLRAGLSYVAGWVPFTVRSSKSDISSAQQKSATGEPIEMFDNCKPSSSN